MPVRRGTGAAEDKATLATMMLSDEYAECSLALGVVATLALGVGLPTRVWERRSTSRPTAVGRLGTWPGAVCVVEPCTSCAEWFWQ